MPVHYGLQDSPAFRNGFLSIGNFDGVHLGHVLAVDSLLLDRRLRVDAGLVVLLLRLPPLPLELGLLRAEVLHLALVGRHIVPSEHVGAELRRKIDRIMAKSTQELRNLGRPGRAEVIEEPLHLPLDAGGLFHSLVAGLHELVALEGVVGGDFYLLAVDRQLVF